MAEQKRLAKVVDFEPLGALLGPRTPRADLAFIRRHLQA